MFYLDLITDFTDLTLTSYYNHNLSIDLLLFNLNAWDQAFALWSHLICNLHKQSARNDIGNYHENTINRIIVSDECQDNDSFRSDGIIFTLSLD